MEISQFDAEAYPVDQRPQAWRDALDHAHLRTSRVANHWLTHGSLMTIISKQHSQFSRVGGDPQTLCWRIASRSDDIWIAAILDGSGQLANGQALRSGDLLAGTMAVGGEVSFSTTFRLLLVHLPAQTVDKRLRRMTFERDRLLEAHGLGRVLANFLHSIAEQMETLNVGKMHPLELCLTEMLIASLSEAQNSLPLTIALRQRSTFQRILQAVEAGLTDADFTLETLAEGQGLSPRAIQKLFRNDQLTFSQYLRRRRLEHAAQDLVDPLQVETMVAEIGFHWGFTDPAHFSRVSRCREP